MATLQIAKIESKDSDDTDTIDENIQPITRQDVKEFHLNDVSYMDLIDCRKYVEIPSKLNKNDKDTISCLCISDTHGQHKGIEEHFEELPQVDILIHSGDFTNIGHWGDIKGYDAWIKHQINKKKFKHCILIGGNHDITLHSQYYIQSGYNRFHAGNPDKSDIIRYKEKCRNRAMKHSIYLQDSSVELFGVTFYGAPWVPWFNNWAFMMKRGMELKNKWKEIPKGIDVLITHGPPIYHGDLSHQFDDNIKSNCVGDVELMKRIIDIKPQFHIFGHNHEGYGVTTHNGLNTVFINAATLNRDYKIANKPILFYIKGQRNLQHKD